MSRNISVKTAYCRTRRKLKRSHLKAVGRSHTSEWCFSESKRVRAGGVGSGEGAVVEEAAVAVRHAPPLPPFRGGRCSQKAVRGDRAVPRPRGQGRHFHGKSSALRTRGSEALLAPFRLATASAHADERDSQRLVHLIMLVFFFLPRLCPHNLL